MSLLTSHTRKKIFRFFKGKIGEERTRKIQYLPFTLSNKIKKLPIFKVSHCCVSSKGIFVSGWLLDGGKGIESVSIRLSDNTSLRIEKHMMRIPRIDIESKYGLAKGSLPGFIAYAPLSQSVAEEGSVVLPEPVRISIRFSDGTVRRKSVSVIHAQSDPLGSIKRILSAVPSTYIDKKLCFDNVYGVAINDIWSLRSSASIGSEYVQYNDGMATETPVVSLIVPIYGRYDFIEYQLCQFVNDTDMLNHQIIYVIDDPRILDEVKTVCEVYERIYKVPFNVLYLHENCGFAGANNQGVKKATGKYVLMLNSDVMPAEEGWLANFVESSASVIDKSLIGIRLLYEDESIQHDGMKFYQSPFHNNLWTNTHPGKGLPTGIVSTDSHLIDVEAVTGACVLLSLENYNLLGGLDESYILGDYEDSDFCLKARRKGLSIKLNRSLHLYHLERQSQSMVSADMWKQELTYYNCWQHSQLWNKDILTIKEHSDMNSKLTAAV